MRAVGRATQQSRLLEKIKVFYRYEDVTVRIGDTRRP